MGVMARTGKTSQQPAESWRGERCNQGETGATGVMTHRASDATWIESEMFRSRTPALKDYIKAFDPSPLQTDP